MKSEAGTPPMLGGLNCRSRMGAFRPQNNSGTQRFRVWYVLVLVAYPCSIVEFSLHMSFTEDLHSCLIEVEGLQCKLSMQL